MSGEDVYKSETSTPGSEAGKDADKEEENGMGPISTSTAMNNAQRKSKFASNISLNVWAEETSPTPNISQVSKFASSQSLNKWSDGSVRSVPVTNLKPDTGKLKNMYGFNIQNMNQAPDGLMSEKERSGSTVAILNDTSSDKVTQQAKDLTFVDCVECFDNMCTIL